MADDTAYEGPVCYLDGWHWSVVDDGAGGEQPGERLVLEDDGTYRAAADEDVSWHERKHQRFATVEMEDGGPGVRVSEQELAAVQELLARLREGGES